MQQLYQFLRWLWLTVILTGLAITLAGDWLSAWLFEGKVYTLSQAVWSVAPVYGPWALLVLLLLLILTLVVRDLARLEHARESFALLKPTEKLHPEDLDFQVLEPGENSPPRKRPF